MCINLLLTRECLYYIAYNKSFCVSVFVFAEHGKLKCFFLDNNPLVTMLCSCSDFKMLMWIKNIYMINYGI